MPDLKMSRSTPPLVLFLIKNAAIGFVMAFIFVGVMLAFNVGNMMTVATQSDVGIFAMVLMTLMIGLTFSSLQMGFAVMFRADDIGKNDKGPGDPLISIEDMQRLSLQPIPIKAKRTR